MQPQQCMRLMAAVTGDISLGVHLAFDTNIVSRCCRLLEGPANKLIPLHGTHRLDRCFLELMQDGEEAFLNFRRVVESANVIMATYADDLLGDTAVCAS